MNNRHHQQTNTQLFTGWILFLSPIHNVKALKGESVTLITQV